MKKKEEKQRKKDVSFSDTVSETKPVVWGVSAGNVSINQNTFPSGHGNIHVDSPNGGYTLSINGFDHDGYPRTSRWYDDD
ncbi:hypothetical protein K9M48_01145 [Candidatus Gracilibacteria bacterium]|nr:hypothetical protein [Candidatus Gracilibacteria bacterium]